MKLTTIEVRGQEFEVGFRPTDGMFTTEFDEATIAAPSIAELTEKLNRATKAVKVAIVFASYRGDGKVHVGTCTGRHATNRNYLVRWDDGTTEQCNGWDLDKRCIDAAFQVEYQSLCDLVNEAVGRRERFEKDHGIHVRAVVDAALENAWRKDKGGAS